MIVECVGGYLSGSLAIATDAAHLLTDFAAFMISLFALWVSSRKPTQSMPFGWYRAEVIGALTSVLTIWVVTGILVYMAVERIIHRDFEIDTEIMLITSGFGVLVNLIMGLTLHQHGHTHGGGSSHGHSHGESENINVRAAFIHVVGDFLQSFGVFVAALVIYFYPDWSIVDPICTFLFSIIVLCTTMAILRDTLNVLMEGMPRGVDFNDVLNTFLSIDGVQRVHNLRIWALSLDKTALAAHLAISPGVNSHEILKAASRKIHSKFHFFEMTLQIEDFQEVMKDCTQCQCPEK
ncbi:zinc transporter 2 [Homalodisca vitripennis]|nr:zinc transporter 2 [Homalodisca vitripennis]